LCCGAACFRVSGGLRLVDWHPFVWLVCLVCVVTLSGVSITGDRFVCLV
jgi:hypothetical protein